MATIVLHKEYQISRKTYSYDYVGKQMAPEKYIYDSIACSMTYIC